MVYASLKDLQDRFGADAVAQLSGASRGQSMDEKRVQLALDDAHAEVDDALSSRFALPLTEVPQGLVAVVCDIAIYRLQSLRPRGDVDDSKDRYKAALKRLQSIVDRTASLAGAPVPSPRTPGMRVIAKPAVFSESLLDRFSGRFR